MVRLSIPAAYILQPDDVDYVAGPNWTTYSVTSHLDPAIVEPPPDHAHLLLFQPASAYRRIHDDSGGRARWVLQDGVDQSTLRPTALSVIAERGASLSPPLGISIRGDAQFTDASPVSYGPTAGVTAHDANPRTRQSRGGDSHEELDPFNVASLGTASSAPFRFGNYLSTTASTEKTDSLLDFGPPQTTTPKEKSPTTSMYRRTPALLTAINEDHDELAIYLSSEDESKNAIREPSHSYAVVPRAPRKTPRKALASKAPQKSLPLPGSGGVIARKTTSGKGPRKVPTADAEPPAKKRKTGGKSDPAATADGEGKDMKWPYERKYILQLIFQSVLKQRKRTAEMELVFNEIFKPEIQALEWKKPFPLSRMRKQERMKVRVGRTGDPNWRDPTWKTITDPTPDAAELAKRAPWDALFASTCQSLNISLV